MCGCDDDRAANGDERSSRAICHAALLKVIERRWWRLGRQGEGWTRGVPGGTAHEQEHQEEVPFGTWPWVSGEIRLKMC
jgi:hypothetical protein